jgi:excisionase family DNA binding protein
MPITTKEAARLLGIHPESVCLAIRQGRLKATRLGKRAFMIRREDLVHYSRNHNRPNTLNLL